MQEALEVMEWGEGELGEREMGERWGDGGGEMGGLREG